MYDIGLRCACTPRSPRHDWQQERYAGGRNEAKRAPWIVAYITIKMTNFLPVTDPFASPSLEASQKHQSGYPDEILVMT